MINRLIYLIPMLLFGAACALPPMATTPRVEPGQPTSLQPPAGLQIEALPYTFQQPTQFFLQGNTLWVAQLNGGENEGNGQVVTVDLSSGDQQILVENLDKPTGIALINQTLWIATRDALLKWPTTEENSAEDNSAGDNSAGEEDRPPEPVLTNLPNNGRSNGTLTVTPDNKLIYETSGNSFDADSGKLWELDPETGQSAVIATGLKGAYAHAFDASGNLWLTEIADGSVQGVTLPGEVNMLTADDLRNNVTSDFGWPRCYGRELAGPDCSDVRAAVTTLPNHSTPTSISISPFNENSVLVALWVTGDVVEISYIWEKDRQGVQNAVGDAQVWLSGLRNPQHIVAAPDGSVWVSEFTTGTIFRVWK